MIRTLAPGLHVLDHNFAIMGLALHGRCTLIELENPGNKPHLWVHSPVPLTPERRAAVEALGTVRVLVAPNVMHHLSLGAWMSAWPTAEVWAAPGLTTKHPELSLPNTLGNGSPDWSASITPRLLRGTLPRLAETVFLHRASRTLLITDLAFHFLENDSWFTRMYLKMTGAWGRMATTPVTRSVISDKALLRTEIDEVLSWDFDRVVMCHGQVLESGGKEALRGAYAWL